jgi:hypothetical protein
MLCFHSKCKIICYVFIPSVSLLQERSEGNNYTSNQQFKKLLKKKKSERVFCTSQLSVITVRNLKDDLVPLVLVLVNASLSLNSLMLTDVIKKASVYPETVR